MHLNVATTNIADLHKFTHFLPSVSDISYEKENVWNWENLVSNFNIKDVIKYFFKKKLVQIYLYCTTIFVLDSLIYSLHPSVCASVSFQLHNPHSSILFIESSVVASSEHMQTCFHLQMAALTPAVTMATAAFSLTAGCVAVIMGGKERRVQSPWRWCVKMVMTMTEVGYISRS